MKAEEAERAGLVARVVPLADLQAEAMKTADKIASMSRPITMLAKEAINRAYDMRGLVATLEYGQEMFCMTAMAHSPEGQEFRKIAREQGLKAAIRWREQRFK